MPLKELFVLRRQLHTKGNVLFHWDPSCRYLATVGANRIVHVFLRSGDLYHEFPVLSGKSDKSILSIEWEANGDYLSVLIDGTSTVVLCSIREKRQQEIDISFKDPSFQSWSRNSSMLAIGTSKGNLILYNAVNMKSSVIQGKHSKKITCGHWNNEGKIALAGLDRMMTVSDSVGELIEQTKLKSEAVDIQFAQQKIDSSKPTSEELTISVNLNRKTILLYNLREPDNPVELAFQDKYGDILTYKWFGDGYMIVGFNKGYVISISTHMKEIGEELQSVQLFNSLQEVVCCPTLNRLAAAGEEGVKVIDMSDWRESKGDNREFTKDEGDVESMEWTKDGQILTVSTSSGLVFNFLTSIPSLAAYSNARIAYLSLLRQITLMDITDDQFSIQVDIALEPTVMALGGTNSMYCGVGFNNRVLYYRMAERIGKGSSGPQNGAECIVNQRDYPSSVQAMAMRGDYAAVLCNGVIHLHTIIPLSSKDKSVADIPPDREYRTFPDSADSNDSTITSFCLTADFLAYGTLRGMVRMFYIRDWAFVGDMSHDSGISQLYANEMGTRFVVFDANQRAYWFNPVENDKQEIQSFPTALDGVIFDTVDPSTFVAVDTKVSKTITTFSSISQTTKGPVIQKIGTTKIPLGFHSVMLCDGNLYGQRATGTVSSMTLASHEAIAANAKGGKRTADKQRAALSQLLALNRLKQSWDMALQLGMKDDESKKLWQSLGRRAMDNLDIEMAIRVFRELRDPAMVMALQPLVGVEDKNLLAGHVLMLNQDYNKAQEKFLVSSSPIQALTMRRDLLHWDSALKLASSLSPESIPAICREYAQQLEVRGEHEEALKMYKKSLQAFGDQKLSDDHIKTANGGIARMTVRTGDLLQGKRLALNSNDKHLMKECAAILESMSQWTDAADMYVQAEQYEKAASIYNLTKNFDKSGPLMDKITTPKIHAQYAKAKEAAKDYQAALVAYERARDTDSVVRLCLMKEVDQPQRAFTIVRQTKSSEGAALVANYCVENNDFQSAVEFMLLAKRRAEAFTMARAHKQMEKYAAALGEDGTPEEYLNIANYYEEQKDFGQAGKFYGLVGDYNRALKLYLMCETQHLDEAINIVKKAQGTPGADLLTRQLHDYLIGETDGKVKDLNYIFRLYMAIGEFQQAAQTAILIANQEQQLGGYTTAHQILLSMQQDLVSHRLPVPPELSKNLLLLHSYTLAKKWATAKNHELAARLLIRVARSISKFPSHIVPILTSTVIECQRAELKSSSFEYASMLMRQEYREQIDQKYRGPIEKIVRRPVKEEKEEAHSPCPFCSFPLPDSLLDCPSCKNTLPFCVSTGQHMLLTDWSSCPLCKFPSRHSAFVERLQQDKACPMCGKEVSVNDISLVHPDDARELLMAQEAANNPQPEDPNAHQQAGQPQPPQGFVGGAAGGAAPAGAGGRPQQGFLSGPPKMMDAVDIPVSF